MEPDAPHPVLGRRERPLAALLALALLAVNTGYVSAHLGFVHRPKRVRETDHFRYLEMAKGTFGRPELARQPPFCWRLLTPALARQLVETGLSLDAAFYLITNVSLFGFLFFLYLWLRALALAPPWAALGVALTGFMQGPVRWFEYQYWMTDPPCLFLVVVGLLLAWRERLLALGALSVIAAFVRESYLVVFPFLFALLWRRHGPAHALRRTAAVAALPMAVYVALRVLIVPREPDNVVDSLFENAAFRWRHLFDNQLHVLTAGTWGVLLPLVLLFPSRLPALLHARPELALATAFVYSTLFISNNTERPLAYAVPFVLPAALAGLRRLVSVARVPFAAAAAVALAVQVFVWTQTELFELGISIYQPTNWYVLAALAATWVGGRVLLRQRGALAPAPASAQ